MAISKTLTSIQKEIITQTLTLRYSKHLKPLSYELSYTDFQNKPMSNHEEFIEKNISQEISNQLGEYSGKIGISLSSGIDSTLVLSLLRKQYPENEIHSISVKFSDSFSEIQASQKISEKFETNHHILEIDNFLEQLPAAISIVEQPFWDLHWYNLTKEMKKYSNVFFSGDGGDELFGGYIFRYKKFMDLTNNDSTVEEKISTYLNCHERDWVNDQEEIFGKNCSFNWNDIHKILKPYFDNSLDRLSQVFLADYNGKLLHNMQPLYSRIHKYFDIKHIAPIQNKELINYSCQLPNNLKYNLEQNTGKLAFLSILEKFGIKKLVSLEKRGFSVNTEKLWYSYGRKIFNYYFDKSNLIEDQIINKNWIEKYISNDSLDFRYVNKFLGLLALEVWYRLFITKEMNSSEKLIA